MGDEPTIGEKEAGRHQILGLRRMSGERLDQSFVLDRLTHHM